MYTHSRGHGIEKKKGSTEDAVMKGKTMVKGSSVHEAVTTATEAEESTRTTTTTVADDAVAMDTKEDGRPSATTTSSALATPASPSPDTVIVFDWDDTLLASSFLSANGYRLDNEMPPNAEIDGHLRELEAAVCALLSHALCFGHVNIVTNAETGWVQLSAQKFLPGVVPFLSRVNVLSARSTFEPHHPDAPLKWKFYAFQEKLTGVFGASGLASSERRKNVISFGDSHVEREACRAVTRGMPNTRTKSVKFAERPSMEQLRRQIELVTNCFQYIHTHDGDLDLQLTVTVNTPSTGSSTPTSSSTGTPAPSSSPSAPSSLRTTEVA
jgi:hypothetical protein